MKVVQVTSSVKGGAGIAAFRLHKALRARGVACAFVSRDYTIDFEGTTHKDTFFTYTKPSGAARLRYQLQSNFYPTPRQKYQKKLQKIEPNLHYEVCSLSFSAYNLEAHPLVAQADIVNFHWMSSVLNYTTFFDGFKKPLVWTLHDMNPFQGFIIQAL